MINNTTSFIQRLACLLVLLPLLAGCGQPPQADALPEEAGAPEIRTISMRLQWFPQFQFAGYIVAEVRGFYDEAGLDVTLNPGSPDFVPMPLVASGADTFGSTGADTIFIARERDIDVVALATWFQASPVAFMVHSDSGIAGPEDFPGRSVAVSYGDNVETEYRALLAATGVDRAQIDEIPGGVNIEPFLSRRVDVWPVYATDQPNQARQQGAEVDLIFARDYGVELMGDVLFTTKEFVAENPNTTQAFVSATLRGWEYAVNNPEETIALIAEYNDELSPEQLQFEATETIKLLKYGAGETCLGWNDQQTWVTEQELLADLGIISTIIPVDTAIDNSFVEAYYAANDVSCSAE